MSTSASPGRGGGGLPPSGAFSKESVIAKAKGLRRSLKFLDTGVVFGAEVMGKISSLGKALCGSMRRFLDVRTEDQRTTLEADGEDMLWVFAKVISNGPEGAADRITRGIRFSVEGKHADWVTLGRPQMKNGMKAVRVKAQPPDRSAQLDDEKVAVVASVTIDGTTFVGAVSVRLEEEVRMKIRFLESRPTE